MAKFEFCRICLVDNVRMFKVDDCHLQGVYQKLTDIPFITEDSRPNLACYLCYARLKQCSRFMMKCLEAEERLASMLDKNDKETSLAANNRTLGDFAKSPIEVFYVHNFHHQSVSATENKDSHETDDINIKKENDSDDEIINREQRIGDANMTKNNEIDFDIDVKVEEHVPDDADVEGDSTGAPAAKKPKLHMQKENKDVTVSNKPKITGLRNTKVGCKRATFASRPELVVEKARSKIEDKEKKKEKRVINKSSSGKCKTVSELKRPRTDTDNKVLTNANVTYDKKRLNDINVKENRYKCTTCQKQFPDNANLCRHIRIHTGEKPYKCDVCYTSFAEKGKLTRHALTHSSVKPFTCDICHDTFSRSTTLKYHLYWTHAKNIK